MELPNEHAQKEWSSPEGEPFERVEEQRARPRPVLQKVHTRPKTLAQVKLPFPAPLGLSLNQWLLKRLCWEGRQFSEPSASH